MIDQQEAERLWKASLKIYNLIQDGVLVRSTKYDDQPDWAIRQIPLVHALKEFQEALGKQ